ncbi:hypothetical protein ACWEQC_09970 [Streptomyces shenzhenensis]
MVPIVLVLLAAGALMIMAHRQHSANERRENAALEQIARQAESYEDDMQDEGRNSYPSQARTRAIAQRNYGTLVSYEPSDRSLTTLVEFFGTYEDTSVYRHLALTRLPLLLLPFPGGRRGRTTQGDTSPSAVQSHLTGHVIANALRVSIRKVQQWRRTWDEGSCYLAPCALASGGV